MTSARPARLAVAPLLRVLPGAILAVACQAPPGHAAEGAGKTAMSNAAGVFDISPGPLGRVLSNFAAAAGLALSFDPALTEGLASAGLAGRYTPREALGRLLAGSGLALVAGGDGSYTLKKLPSPASGPDDRLLPEVRVSATGASRPDSGMPWRSSVAGLDADARRMPRSIGIVGRDTLEQQNPAAFHRAMRNVSGVDEGSGTNYGFYDRFLVRGLEANFLRDGLPDGPSTNGYSRTLLGIERIEVLKGPGAALFGSGHPGGSINLLRRAASPVFAGQIGATAGAFGRRTAQAEVSGPVGDGTLRYRLEGLVSKENGFRRLGAEHQEFAGALEWHSAAHLGAVTLERRRQKILADSDGIPFRGTVLLDVSLGNSFYTPFGGVDQDVGRLSVADTWRISDVVEISHRFAYLTRDVAILRNSGGSIGANSGTMTGRQLRRQHDDADDFVYRFEPVFRLALGSTRHTVLAGLEYQRRELASRRETARLPNIADVFAPAIPESSERALTFMPDFTRGSRFASTALYAADRIALTDRLTVRTSVRLDRFATDGRDDAIGATRRRDSRVGWESGVSYEIRPGVFPFAGVSRGHLVQLGSETADVDVAPERATQGEVGVKLDLPARGLEVSGVLFDTRRENFPQTIGGERLPVGEQRARGTELDLDYRPLPWLHLSGNLSRLGARLVRLPSTPGDEGKRPAGVPKYMGALWANLEFPAPAGRWGGGLGVRRRGLIYANNANTLAVPAYTVADAALYYRAAGSDIRIDVRNLFDRDYYRYALPRGAFPGEPRTVSVTVRFNF